VLLKKPKRRVKVPKKFKSLLPSDRLNSEMIRRVFYDTIATDFDRDIGLACDAFFLVVKDLSDRRPYDSLLTVSSLRKAVADTHYITYKELNALAKYHKIPISALLLFTRIRDEMETVEKRQSGDAWRVLTAVRAALEHLESQVDRRRNSDEDVFDIFGHSDFMEYVQSYTIALQQKETPVNSDTSIRTPRRRKSDSEV
jgi:hypothetical protein